MQRSALCRSRRELSNAYLLAKFGFDTTENEPCKVCPIPQRVRLTRAWFPQRGLAEGGNQEAAVEDAKNILVACM